MGTVSFYSLAAMYKLQKGIIQVIYADDDFDLI